MTKNVSIGVSQDERIMAGLAHVSVFLPMLGLIVPALVWITQKDKSPFLRFQALQAIVYQLSLLVAWMVGLGCYMGSAFASMFILSLIASNSARGDATPMLAFLIPLAVMALMLLGVLVYIANAIYAALQAFRGKDFKYFVIGDRIERYLQGGKPAADNQSV